MNASSKSNKEFAENSISVGGNASVDDKMDNVEIPMTVISKVFKQHDIALLEFVENTTKPIVSDCILKTEIFNLDCRRSQNTTFPVSKGTFLEKKTGFEKKRGNHSYEVNRLLDIFISNIFNAFDNWMNCNVILNH